MHARKDGARGTSLQLSLFTTVWISVRFCHTLLLHTNISERAWRRKPPAERSALDSEPVTLSAYTKEPLDLHSRLFLIGERFFHNFQRLEINGDMYQYTEAFCHYSWTSPRARKSSSLTFQYLEKKNRKIKMIEKLREKNVEIMENKLSDKNDP